MDSSAPAPLPPPHSSVLQERKEVEMACFSPLRLSGEEFLEGKDRNIRR